MHKQLVLPDADMIIHCGDFTSMGYEHEIKSFFKWFSKLDQYKDKIIIAGNHEILFEDMSLLAKSFVPINVHYLEDSGIEIDGYYFYGTPVQNPFNDWAFNRPEHKLQEHWLAIPTETDILITHNPPYMIGDYIDYKGEHAGSPSLYFEIVERIKPMLHVFGHIHEGRVTKVIEDTTFINATNVSGHHQITYNPVLVEIENGKVNVISD